MSRVIRRTHMFLALFLAPWMVMYALSTFVMNHREWVSSFYPDKSPALSLERELDYARSFPTNATPAEMARAILADLGLEGAHRVRTGTGGKPLIIDRQQAWAQRKITFNADTAKITVDREAFRGPVFLERMHRRRGYQQPDLLNDSWAASVDLAMIASIFWSLSGLWLWWELRSTRAWGAVAAGLGLVSFVLFLLWL